MINTITCLASHHRDLVVLQIQNQSLFNTVLRSHIALDEVAKDEIPSEAKKEPNLYSPVTSIVLHNISSIYINLIPFYLATPNLQEVKCLHGNMRPNKSKHLHLLQPKTACPKRELKPVHSDITEIY